MYPYPCYFSIAVATSVVLLNPSVNLQTIPLTFAAALAQTQTSQEQETEAARLNEQAHQQLAKGKLREALTSFRQILVIQRAINDLPGEAEALNNVGEVYKELSQYQKALDSLQQALAIHRRINHRQGEGETLSQLGDVYNSLGQTLTALEILEQALAINREVSDRAGEGETLYNLGEVYNSLSQYNQSLSSLQQALLIRREVGDRLGEGRTLQNLGLIYRQLGKYAQALEFYEQSLAINQAIGDLLGRGRTLNGMGMVYRSRGQYAEAQAFYQQALEIRRTIGDRIGEASSLNSIGTVYAKLGEYSQAMEFYEQALEIAKEIESPASQESALTNIGGVYYSQGKYPQALELYQQALAITQSIGNPLSEGLVLNNIGGVYQDLGQYSQAIKFYRQALSIQRAISHQAGEAATLNNLSAVYLKLGQDFRALESYQEALKIRKSIGDQAGVGATLNNLGLVYDNIGQHSQAVELYQQALAILQTVGDQAGEGLTLNNIGIAHYNLGNSVKALESFEQALGILREIGDRAGESLTLNNIGYLFSTQEQPELAIIFYKQSVKLIEEIRQDLRVLSREEQESYIETVAETYRSLADLLLSQGRVLEAQQVLELLKMEELREFTRNTNSESQTIEIAMNRREEQTIQEHSSLIALGKQIYECQQTRCQQLSQLLDQRDVLTQEFNQVVEQLEQQVRDRLTQDDAILDPKDLSRKAREIVEAQPRSVLIYPLVLEDKIWLLWAAQGGIVKTVEVPVGQHKLGETVLQFRQLLQNPRSDIAEVKATGKQLYNWLIEPLAEELQKNQIQNLIFSLDRVTRYIPISALFDGEEYLVENYAISTILSADLTDTRDRLPPGRENTSVLALGLSKAVAGFNPLPNVPAELDAIVKHPSEKTGIYPGKKFLNSEFNFRSLRDNLLKRQVVHIATHGKFVPGRPEDSYLLLGDGEKLTIPRIETLQDLVDTHLVVLSACETALGGSDQDGVEIAGISYYFLNRGAKAVIASLWLVNDASTSQLMQQFYGNLAQGTAQEPITKSHALRLAQLSLIQGDTATTNTEERANIIPISSSETTSRNLSNLSHPYYWAPFVLIGNGL
ncbi:MAG: tetratricopeptide repeat protein [Symploca sp. SIO2G7]|nr:tetratricopeptide repeat protein [Symploca sp. SIO2G7]